MSIYISNDLYLQDIQANIPNRPLVGYRSVLRPSDISPSPENPDSPGSNTWSPDTYTSWQSLTDPDFPLDQEVDLINAGADPIDYIAIAGHNFGTSGVTYSIESASDGINFDTVVVAPKIVGSDASIIEYFDESQHAKFRIVFLIPAAKFVKISHIKMGKILQLERPRYVNETPAGMDVQTEMIRSKSDSGQIVSSVLTSSHLRYNISQNHNLPAKIRAEIIDLLRHCQLLEPTAGNGPRGTFFYAWRPDTYPAEVMYCDTPSSVTNPSNQLSNGMMEFSLSGTGVK